MIELPQITLCAICKNEAENIPKGMGAIPWPTRKLIVDTGSDDGTPEVAKKHGFEVVHFDWIQNFAAARNVWHEHVTSGWIFWMDGDDSLPEGMVELILELVMDAPKSTMAFLTEYEYPNGYVCDHLRLYRADLGIKWRGRIHEALDFSDIPEWYKENGEVVRPEQRLYVKHDLYPVYDRALIEAKSKRNMELLFQWLEDEPDEPIIYQYIGTDYMAHEEYEKAAHYLEEARKRADPRFTFTWLPEVYINLSRCYTKLGRIGKAKKMLKKGRSVFTDKQWEMFLDRQLRMKAGDGRTAFEIGKERQEQTGVRIFR